MIFVLIVLAVLVSILAAVAMGEHLALVGKGNSMDTLRSENERLSIEKGRMESGLRSMITPLTWIHQADRSTLDPVTASRVNHALVNVFQSVALGLKADDVEMAELIERASEPPRRLPHYPRVPPYLATPEDVAMTGVPTGGPVQVVRPEPTGVSNPQDRP